MRPPQRHVGASDWPGTIWQGCNVILWGFFCGQRSVRLVLSLGYMGGNFCDGCISFVFCHEKKQEHVDLHCSAMQTCPARCQRMHLALECADMIEDSASTQNCWG